MKAAEDNGRQAKWKDREGGVCEATGMAHKTIKRGMKGIEERLQIPAEEQTVSA